MATFDPDTRVEPLEQFRTLQLAPPIRLKGRTYSLLRKPMLGHRTRYTDYSHCRCSLPWPACFWRLIRLVSISKLGILMSLHMISCEFRRPRRLLAKARIPAGQVSNRRFRS